MVDILKRHIGGDFEAEFDQKFEFESWERKCVCLKLKFDVYSRLRKLREGKPSTIGRAPSSSTAAA